MHLLCIPGDPKTSSLRVSHKLGPCAPLGPTPRPTHADILKEDRSRVNWINSRLTSRPGPAPGLNQVRQSEANIPARSGSTIGSASYAVTVGLGTPKQDLSLVFDTGSSLTWTQCKPCVIYCYQQYEPIFDPSGSTTYVNISCTSAACSQLTSATGKLH